MRKMNLTTFDNNMYSNDAIFKMFNPNGNDSFSDMSKKELREFLLLLDDYLIDFRDRLIIENNSTFSPEIECVDANFVRIKEELNSSNNCLGHWDWSYEDTLPKEAKYDYIDNKEYELTSREFTPILLSNSTWDVLYEMCSIINKYSNLDDNCGLHMNYGEQILGDDNKSLLNLCRFITGFEDIMFGYGTGEFDEMRYLSRAYAYPVASKWYPKLRCLNENSTYEKILHDLGESKINSISLLKLKPRYIGRFFKDNVLEYRFNNASTNPVIIQNIANIEIHGMMYAKSDMFDEGLIDYYMKDLYDNMRWRNMCTRIDYYTELIEEKFLRFIDLIFSSDNKGCNLDKINASKQYFKSMDYIKSKGIK